MRVDDYTLLRIEYILIDIFTIILCIIIIINGYKKMFKQDHIYTYIIKPALFIKKLAVNGASCCIFGLLFKLCCDIYLFLLNMDAINLTLIYQQH